MVRDYARRDPLKRAPRRAPQTKPLWPLVTIGILSGALIATGLSWYLFSKPSEATQAQVVATEHSALEEEVILEAPQHNAQKKRVKKNTSVAEQPAETRFDFYTVLPTTESPEVTSEPDKALTTAPPPPQLQKILSFMVQAGSFDTPNAADSLKAQLALQGLEPQTQRITTESGQIWYRVYFGPFKSEQEAVAQQQALNNNGITNSLILKLDR